MVAKQSTAEPAEVAAPERRRNGEVAPGRAADRPAGARITLSGVTKRYADIPAVADVDLDIEPGEFMTLLGPSGSGKTTTLNVIAGFVQDIEGRLEIDGHEVSSVPAHRRNVGVVFQHYALFPHMTVAENIAFPLKQRKVERRKRTELVEAALEMVRLTGYGARHPRELSGGQQQRVALARAVVYQPRVLLMDEPLGALDKKLRDFLQLEIKRVHAELGTTFVYVTHDQDEALVLSDRIAVFNGGRIEQVGAAHELYERPATLFVAQFLGDSTVLRGTATGQGDGEAVVTTSERSVRAKGGGIDGDVALVIRPERVSVLPRGAEAPTGWNNLPARLIREVYLGSTRKLELRLPDGSTALAREMAGQLSDTRVEDEVTLAWRPEDGVLLADDPEADRVLT